MKLGIRAAVYVGVLDEAVYIVVYRVGFDVVIALEIF